MNVNFVPKTVELIFDCVHAKLTENAYPNMYDPNLKPKLVISCCFGIHNDQMNIQLTENSSIWISFTEDRKIMGFMVLITHNKPRFFFFELSYYFGILIIIIEKNINYDCENNRCEALWGYVFKHFSPTRSFYAFDYKYIHQTVSFQGSSQMKSVE